MSTHAVGTSQPITVPPRKGPEAASPQEGRVAEVAAVQAIPRQPSYGARTEVACGMRTLLAEGFDYRDAMAIVKAIFLDLALEQCGRSPKKASALLHTSREHLRRARVRAKEIGL